ncbi:MAG: hypothetical protein HZB24_03320 [Desulfobacterales bacterium]|nr:hypothetical protein [Desulfobacterales bacterium]
MDPRKQYVQRKLDIEIGHLIKSPCRACASRHRFPRCFAACKTLDRVQTYLAQGISTCRAHSALEPFILQLEGQRPK